MKLLGGGLALMLGMGHHQFHFTHSLDNFVGKMMVGVVQRLHAFVNS